MSSRLTPEQVARVRKLTQAVYHEQASPDEMAELHRWIQCSREAAWIYAQYMHLFAGLHWDKMQKMQKSKLGQPTAKLVPADGSPVLGFLSDCFRQGVSFLSKSSVFSLLVAIGLPGLVLLTLVVGLVDQAPVEQPGPVATVARACNCVGHLGDGHTLLSAGMELAEGQRFTLRSGFVEIEFADGARAILEAPTAFEVRHGNAGFLQMGRLVASVPPKAHGFAIETPLVTVVDLGTDFGVSVAADGTAEAHVFAGQIEVATKTMPENPTSLARRLRVGQAARIRMTDAGQAPRIEAIIASSDQFVRRLPVPSPHHQRIAPPDAARAKTRLIASVDRHNGAAYDGGRNDSFDVQPTGVFDGETDPLASDNRGLRLGARLYSDRPYVVEDINESLVGAEYIRTFNTDKEEVLDVDSSYDVTFATDRREVYVMVLVDDRFEKGGGQQGVVDSIVSRFAGPGEFVDTGYNVDTTDHQLYRRSLSAFGRMLPTRDASGNPITYIFSTSPRGKLAYVIAALTEPPRPQDSRR